MCIRLTLIGIAWWISQVAAGGGETQAIAPLPVGEVATDFQLHDVRGKVLSLSACADQQVVVLAFVGTECPLAAQYAPRLVQIAKRYADKGVVCLAIDSNRQDSLAEMSAFAARHQIEFPFLRDVGNVVADQLGATRTPEVVVLDRERRVCYRGRIDDQYVVGRQRPAALRDDLTLALDAVLAGKPVECAVTEVQGCLIGRLTAPLKDSSVTYARDVAAILNAHCVECHRPGEIAPFGLSTYDEAAAWAPMIEEVVSAGRMPPWFANPAHGKFKNDRRLSNREKSLLVEWARAGAPEGNPQDVPPATQFAAGWRLPRVDREVFMSAAPFQVPESGAVRYQYFTVDPSFTEDMWIQGAECRPGNRAVVHHIIVGIRPPKAPAKQPGEVPSVWLTATAPGAQPLCLADGQAKLVPAGSQLVFQMHYTPNGTSQVDRSSVGLMFAKAEEVRREVGTIGIENHFFAIPPQVSDHRAEAWLGIRRDTVLLSLFPHMHLRGKAFRYEARYPDGTSEILLDVPRYDFAWQDTYALAEPKLLPKGTQLHCTAHFDNSAENIANPNPDRVVIWGDQTWDEMLIGYIDVMLPEDRQTTAR